MHDGECPHLPSSSAAFLASHIQSLSPSHLACTDCGASSTDLWLCLSVRQLFSSLLFLTLLRNPAATLAAAEPRRRMPCRTTPRAGIPSWPTHRTALPGATTVTATSPSGTLTRRSMAPSRSANPSMPFIQRQRPCPSSARRRRPMPAAASSGWKISATRAT
mgnify:CR=1 FL=1